MNILILPILAIMIAVGIFFTYVRPTWLGSIAETREIIAQNDAALNAAMEYKNKENELASAYTAIDSGNLARLSLFLPDSVDNVRLILDINSLMARSGISLADIEVTASSLNNEVNVSAPGAMAAPRANPVGYIDLSLSAVGTYDSFLSLLDGIERSARFLEVLDISVDGSDTGVYKYNMTIRTYWLR